MKNDKLLYDNKHRDIGILGKSILIGIAAGGSIVLYRILLSNAETFCFSMYDFLRSHWIYIPAAIILLGLAAFLIGFMISKNKMVGGSGLPHLEAILKGYFKERKSWWNTLVLKIIGATIAIAGGLSLGRGGPSVQLGSCVAEGVSQKMSHSRREKKILMASGTSAGLAAAFNAPIAGVTFALEEIFKHFSPIILLSTMSAAVAADFIAKVFFGMAPVFDFKITQTIPLKSYGLLILLGVIVGGLGVLYNWTLNQSNELFAKMKFLTPKTKLLIPFACALVLGLVFPVVLCGGQQVLTELTPENGILLILLIFVIKFIFSMICLGSGAPGGIFFPLLILGASIGSIYAILLIQYTGLDASLYYNFIILAMAGYFTAIVRAPVTGVVLIMEMTGSFSHILPLTVVSITAYVVANLLHSTPVFTKLLDRLIQNEQRNRNP